APPHASMKMRAGGWRAINANSFPRATAVFGLSVPVGVTLQTCNTGLAMAMPMIICCAMVDSPVLTVSFSRSRSDPRGVHNIGLLVKTSHGLRALMQSALPRLITTTASGALSLRRFGGSRSDRSCHQLDYTSHCAESLLPVPVK